MMKPCDVQFLPTLLYAAKRIRANVTREQLPLLGFLRGGRLGFLAPGIGVDVDDLAMLGKAVDESDDASGARKDGAPLLVRQVGGDDGGFGFVPATDDVVQEVGRSAVAGQVSEFVDYQDVRR